jgi:hypothetical protein
MGALCRSVLPRTCEFTQMKCTKIAVQKVRPTRPPSHWQ